MAMATDPNNKFRKRRNQNMKETYEYLQSKTHSEPEVEKYIKRQWPLTHQTNREQKNHQIQACTKPMTT
jgi:predicted transposase YbfD/YdcC